MIGHKIEFQNALTKGIQKTKHSNLIQLIHHLCKEVIFPSLFMAGLNMRMS